MRNILLLLPLCFALVLFGCAKQKPETHVAPGQFDARQAKNLLAKGPNTVQGTALMRKSNGDAVTCAGKKVGLIPLTAYSQERMAKLYGNSTKGVNPINPDGTLMNVIEGVDPEYERLVLQTVCDRQGFFTFENVADGTFFAITGIGWKAGTNNAQGAGLMQRVTVSGGETKDILLATP